MKKKFNYQLALILFISFIGVMIQLIVWTIYFRDSYIYTMDLFLILLIIVLACGSYSIEEHYHE